MSGNHKKVEFSIITSKKIRSTILIIFLLGTMFTGLIVINNFVEDAEAITVPGDYPTIQDAINNSIEGGTIYVWAGTYNESITVNKTLTIIGNGTSNTTINGQGTGDVVNIISHWVNITGFTITNGGNGTFDSGIELDNVQNCNITNNIIRSNGRYGIRLVNSSDNTVASNILAGNKGDNIYLDNSHGNVIDENIVEGIDGINRTGLVGNWRMDEGRWEGINSDVRDSGIFENHGFTNGSADTTNDAKMGRAGYFDGVNDFVGVPESSSLNITSDITISVWVKPEGAQDNHDAIVHKFSGFAGNYMGYRIRTQPGFQPQFEYGDGTPVISNIYGPILSPDQWYHIVAQKEGTTLRMYVNGVLVNSATGSASIAGTPIDLFIGFSDYNTQYFKGVIDEVAIYDSALTESEIAGLYRFSGCGIRIEDSTYNSLTKNEVSLNKWGCILHSSEYNDIINNTIGSNRLNGIYLVNSSENNVSQNTLKGNGDDNVHLENSHDNDILDNNVYSLVDIDKTNLVGYWRMDERFWDTTQNEVTDDSGQGNHGTAVNEPKTRFGRFGRAGYFTDNGEYIEASDSASLDITDEITISAWVYPEDVTVNRGIVYKHQNWDLGEMAYALDLLYPSGIYPRFWVSSNGFASGYTEVVSSEAVEPYNWYHIVATYDGSDICIYVNGILRGTQPHIGGIHAGNDPLRIGWSWVSGWKGALDELAIYNRSLSQGEIDALYHATISVYGICLSHSDGNNLVNNTLAFSNDNGIHLVNSNNNTMISNSLLDNELEGILLENSNDNVIEENVVVGPEDIIDSGLVAYWKMDEGRWSGIPGEVEDHSGKANHGTAYGNANTTAVNFGRAGTFDDNEDYVDVGAGSSLQIGGVGKSFTLEAWTYRESKGTGDIIISHGVEAQNEGLHFGYRVEDTFTFAFWGDDLVTAIPYPDVNEWHHWVGTYDGVTRERRLYRDGILEVSDTSTGAYIGTGPMQIGMYFQGWFFHGKIDEVRIYNYMLLESEVARLYQFPTSGIRIIDSENNEIIHNDVRFNNVGILLDSSKNNTVSNNTVCSNRQSGIYLMSSSENNVTQNILNGNKIDNIHLENSHDNTIQGNNISGRAYIDKNGLVGYWKMDEASWSGAAGEVIDYSGMGNDGRAENGVSTASGKFQRAGDFEASSNNYVTIPTSDSLNITKNITIEAWVKLESYTGTHQTIVYKGYAYNLMINSGNYAQMDVYVNGDWRARWSSTVIPLNQWTHIVGTFNCITGLVRIFVNGVEENGGNQDNPYPSLIALNENPVNFSYNPDYGGRYIDSLIDEVSIYNRSLSEIEIAQRYLTSDYGIRIHDSINSTVINNTVIFNENTAIRLSSSHESSITSNNISENSGIGIRLDASGNNIISGNNITSNNREGIYLDSSNGNTISSSDITMNDRYGIYLDASSNNVISGNNFIRNNLDGICLDHSSKGNTIVNNTALNNYNGIYLNSSGNNTILSNNISWNLIYGIVLFTSSTDNKILDNNISHNDNGILLSLSSNNNTVSGNDVVSNTDEGIYLSNSAGNDILDNNVSDNDWGIFLILWCNNNTISGNNITWNIQSAIHIINKGNDNTISNNKIKNNDIAVYIGNSNNNNITENNISDHRIGINFNSCTGGTISSNNVSLSTQYGIRLESSDGITILNNNVFSNNEGISLEGSNSNLIYHNNFISNTQHGYDDGTNSWNLPYPQGGNHWDDWTTPNDDGDRFVDIPRPITGGINLDHYPWANSSGWTLPSAYPVTNLDTLEVFLSIQEAIDDPDTLDGHTIWVAIGRYYENVIVNKTLNLVGEYRNLTVIDGGGNGHVVIIEANLTTITEFNITNSGGSDAGIYLDHANNCAIYQNIIKSNSRGIHLESSNNDTISYNHISDTLYGIYLSSSNGSTIFRNSISYNGYGIAFWLSSTNNTISGNNITNQSWNAIELHDSNDNIISNNNVFSNYRGIYFHKSSNNIISGNNISWNIYEGIYFTNGCNNNTISGNNITMNRDHGVNLMLFSNDNTISANTITSNKKSGICLSSSNDNIISGNEITSNNRSGIFLYSMSNYNEITNNDILSNTIDGIMIKSSSSNTISQNTIVNNSEFGINISSSSNENIISYNDINNNSYYAVYINSSSSNLIHHNNIANNNGSTSVHDPVNIQGYDDGSNLWDFNSQGNWWMDWTVPDSIAPFGIVDNPYILNGGGQDNFPLVSHVESDPPTISDFQPSQDYVTNNNLITINCSYSDPAGINENSVLLEIDGINVTSSTTVTQSGVSYTPAIELDDGLHTVSLWVMDIFDNLIMISWQFTVDSSPPTPINDLTALNPSFDSINLTWTAPSDNGSIGSASGYIVKYSTTGSITDANWDVSATYVQSWTPQSAGSTEYHIVSGFSHGTRFWFAIKSYDELDNLGSTSNSPNETTLVATPSVPQNIQAESTDSYIRLTWNAPTSSGKSPITNYRIYRGYNPGTETFLEEISNVLFYNDIDVTNGITYYYKVSAKNLEGEGVLSEEKSIVFRSTTDIPPTIIDKSPTGDNIPIVTTITIVFSEEMNHTNSQGAFSISPEIPGTFSWSGNTMIFTLSNNLQYDTQYIINISTNASDLTGNGLISEYSWKFTTESAAGVIHPYALDNSWKPTGTNVPMDTTISISFSEPMNKDDTEDAFSITPAVSGVFTWEGTTLIFTPNAPLTAKTQYNVSISTNAKNLNSISLDDNYNWSFITGETKVKAEGITWETMEPIVTGLTIIASILLFMFGFLSLRKKRGKLRGYLEKIDEIFKEYKDDYMTCEKELISLREEIKGHVKDGKLEENHFLILDKKIDDYLFELKALERDGKASSIEDDLNDVVEIKVDEEEK
ncbi:MAG: right-handed parallel beta-helix repeat-containing protein [Thermoplasmata archaeon]|nr:MAG: right-handed parallel beta-helix repeat-containing protein [Thermoplasmata archaeon]